MRIGKAIAAAALLFFQVAAPAAAQEHRRTPPCVTAYRDCLHAAEGVRSNRRGQTDACIAHERCEAQARCRIERCRCEQRSGPQRGKDRCRSVGDSCERLARRCDAAISAPNLRPPPPEGPRPGSQPGGRAGSR